MGNDLISPDSRSRDERTSVPAEFYARGGVSATIAVITVLGVLAVALVNLRPRHASRRDEPLLPDDPDVLFPTQSTMRVDSTPHAALSPMARGGGPRASAPAMHDVVRFPVDGTHLQPAAVTVIDRFALALRSDPRARVQIETAVASPNARGGAADLSQRRSEAVRNELIRHGVTAQRIVVSHRTDAATPSEADLTDRRPEHRRIDLTLSR